jgi:hypothetical protein
LSTPPAAAGAAGDTVISSGIMAESGRDIVWRAFLPVAHGTSGAAVLDEEAGFVGLATIFRGPHAADASALVGIVPWDSIVDWAPDDVYRR